MKTYDIAELCATKVSPLFQLMGWQWWEKDRTVNHEDLRRQLEELLAKCKEDGSIATGRLEVARYKDEEGRPMVRVSLDLYEGEYEDDE
jgi:hypothetical protein